LLGFNDLATTHPDVAREAYGWNPVEIFGGTHLRKPFKCSEGHTYSATIKDRTVNGSGCPECSKTGFNPGKSGFLYFLEHPKWEMLQIGITNNIDHRTTKHKNKGWHLIEFRGPIDGLLAMNWETSILRMLKSKGADLSNEKIAGKFDGYSEAWSKSTFEVKSIKELMRLTEVS
jgi:predicted GIY-YIG superfamily endonuclease